MTRLKSIALGVAAALTLVSGAQPASHAAPTAQAYLINAAGEAIGIASLIQGAGGVLIHVRVEGLTPGAHGLHLHSHSVCEAHEGFKTAKGHVGKVQDGHGLLNPKGPEPGDIPNIFVGLDGIGEMEAFNPRVSLVEGPNNLLDADGSTLVIHERADNNVNQPIGGAGGRVACGVIVAG